MNYINAIGLIIDIAGALILFKYGLPSNIHLPPRILAEQGLSEEEIKENATIRCMARVGICCLIFGFCCQLTVTILASFF